MVGPTAIGKTALAIQIAKQYNCDIISCDSRQFYKEMNIGTAVPSKEELESAKHHFIQHISISQNYSVGDFEKQAIAKLDSLFKQNNIQVMVGGSGLFVNAIINGLDEFPDVDPSIRQGLNKQLQEQGLLSLQQRLKQLDPVHYNNVALDNPMRVIRALEVCIASGKPYSSFLNQNKNKRNFTPIVIGLQADRQKMYDRINLRVDIMMQNGLLQEATALLEQRENNALQTVGYREIFSYLLNEFTLEQAIEEIKKNTRRFAKRQITWFKRTPDIHWFDFQSPIKEIFDTLNKIITK